MAIGLPRRRRRLLVAAALLLALSGGWFAGLIRFAGSLPHDVDDRETRTDAIVVLTGGSERLTTGLRLLGEGKAERLLVSGVYPTVDVATLLQSAGREPAALADRVDIGRGARDTAGNAAETARWMAARGYRSLRLVTSGYHMPRSLLEFERALPDVRVIPHSVMSEHVRQDDWWQWPGTAALFVGEYNKYLLAWLTAGRSSVPVAEGSGRP
jgi:uncharacterized SAM-binding protein YcdF (DUF218 family)